MIHTFGDSHSRFGWEKVKIVPININHIGAKLMHTFGKEKEKLIDLSKYTFNKDDILVYCFGEIDCRCHVHKFINHNVPYQKIIDKLTNIYVEAVINNKKYYDSSLVKTAIYCVIPAIKQKDGQNNHDYPFLGTDEQRKAYHVYMNEQLTKLCQDNYLIFIDVTKEYSNQEGFLNPVLSDRRCHIDNPDGLENVLRNMGLAQ